ncbi:MFS transporter [Bordetella genomosp. 11]|uniref:MFS transporter n=1 Tax=Bordetella genomosp. 11 TaxID=1416808 RepID=A0A261UL14_9BORD|nr:MFS transporter [Bordetella genomosp. 11]OZI62052.1 MFS transporter [Bordetella genomosp. 11]
MIDRISPTDAHSRNAAATLALTLPGDTVLYLILPIYAAQFGVSLAEAGVLLAANRLVRIAGYGWVARFYARHGDRPTCMLAAAAATLSALGYATLTGFWALVPLRLLWGLSFAALNLSTQAMATADPVGVARRNGRSRAVIAMGPVVALPLGAWMAELWGPRAIFFVLALVAFLGVVVAHRLPSHPHSMPQQSRRLRLPGSLDTWSFLEGFTLDGLFIIGLSYLGKDLMPAGSVIVAGVVLALRYLGEIVLSPVGGRLAERFGPVRLLVWLSVLTAIVLVGFGVGWIWSCAAAIVVLRALQLPLLPPIVAMRTPGPGRVQALASRAVWRDIGAGTGPLLAGVMLPLVSPVWIYSVPAVLLALSALACAQPGSSGQDAG